MATMMETIVIASPTAEGYAMESRLYMNQKGEPTRERIRMVFSFEIQKAPVCRRTPIREKMTRGSSLTRRRAAMIIAASESKKKSSLCRPIKPRSFRAARREAIIPRISNAAPPKERSRQYCKM